MWGQVNISHLILRMTCTSANEFKKKKSKESKESKEIRKYEWIFSQ
jgi:hypothetical protein